MKTFTQMKTLTLTLLTGLIFLTGTVSAQKISIDQIAPCEPKEGADAERSAEAYSLYREFYKQDNWKDAFPYWKYLFFNAPGLRQTTFVDGAKAYGDMIEAEKDEAKKERLIDTLMVIYDVRMRCFGEEGTYGRKALDMYKYRPADVENNLAAFEHMLQVDGNNTAYYMLLPYVVTMEKALKKNLIDTSALIDNYMKIVAIVDANQQDKYAEKYNTTLESVNERMLRYLECSSIVPILRKQYEADKENEATMTKIFDMLYTLQCFSDPLFKEIAPVIADKDPSEKTYYILAVLSRNESDYNTAIDYLNKALGLATTNADKAKYSLEIAKLYQAKKDFPSARNYALKAADYNPSSGEPYMLIGDLYMSSGPLCGSGTGWESQVVTWVAVDMYTKAKSVDPSVSADASKKIANAAKYYPTNGECFFRSLKTGDSFKVECWIQRTTTVRCSEE